MEFEFSGFMGYLLPLLIIVIALWIVIAILKNLKTLAVIGMAFLLLAFAGAGLLKSDKTAIGELKIGSELKDGHVVSSEIFPDSNSFYIGFDTGTKINALDLEVQIYKSSDLNTQFDKKSILLIGSDYALFTFDLKGKYTRGDYNAVVLKQGIKIKESQFKIS